MNTTPNGDLRNVTAEEQVLGSMLQGCEAVRKAAAILDPADFSSEGRERIFRVLVDMERAGRPIDLTLVGDELARRGELEQLGGPLELTRIVERVPSGENVREHAEVVRDFADRRRLAAAAARATAYAHDLSVPVDVAKAEVSHVNVSSPHDAKAIVRRAADVEARPIKWLWERRIPRGMLTQLSGVPKVGKTLALVDIAARVTRGKEWPDGTPNTAGQLSVLMVNVEDPVAEVQRPRLEAAGADLEKVFFVDGVTGRGGSGALLLDGDGHLGALEAEIRSHGDVGLVVLDPISAFFGHTNTWRDTDVRRVLSELADVAERTGTAIVAVSHMNKRSGDDGSLAIHRVAGSGAFTAAARSLLLIGRRPGEERSILASLGGNLAASVAALAFTVVERAVSGGALTGAIEWDLTPLQVEPEELLRAASRRSRDDGNDEVDDWLRAKLDPAGTILPSADIEAEATGAGISERQLKAARQRLGVETLKIEGGMRWGMRLPSDPAA